MKEYLSILKRTSLFHNIKKEELEGMLKCLGAYVKSYEKNSYIAMAGEEIDWIGIVLKGRINILFEDIKGGKSIIASMGEEELFGESFACDATSNSTVSIMAAENTTILFIRFKRVIQSCNMACVFHHKLIENMVSQIAVKNHQLMKKVQIISHKTLRERILAYLSVQAAIHTSPYFTIPMGRLELADYLCADRSALTRELSRMKEEGLLDYDRNTFKLKT